MTLEEAIVHCRALLEPQQKMLDALPTWQEHSGALRDNTEHAARAVAVSGDAGANLGLVKQTENQPLK